MVFKSLTPIHKLTIDEENYVNEIQQSNWMLAGTSKNLILNIMQPSWINLRKLRNKFKRGNLNTHKSEYVRNPKK